MCYTGGPYCVSGMRPKLAKAKDAFYKNSTMENRDALLKATLDYNSTLTGQKELKKKIEEASSELEKKNLERSLDIAQKRRAEQKKARKEREAKEGVKPTTEKTKSTTAKAKKSPFQNVNEEGRPMPSSPNPSAKETAATIRKELRHKFPDSKMSVTMARGTAYGWMSVSYTDGPSQEEVRDLMFHYENSSFNHYTDVREYHQGAAWNATGINVSKDYSEGAVNEKLSAIETNDSGERYIKSKEGDLLVFERYPHEMNEQLARRACEEEAKQEYLERKQKSEGN